MSPISEINSIIKTPQILWNALDAAAATGGRSQGGIWEASGVSIDTRSIQNGDLFIALHGPSHNGHDYIVNAFDNGASAAIVDTVPPHLKKKSPLLVVKDTHKALNSLAIAARRRTRAKVFAITGSVGKTGTKEMLAAALSKVGLVSSTKGNENNEIGVPLNLARLPENCDFGVFEAGMNSQGEMARLSEIIRPDIALITTVEAAHTEHFDNIDAIANAKGEIFTGLNKNGIGIINLDNPYFSTLEFLAKQAGLTNIKTFGQTPKADLQLISAITTNFDTKVTAKIIDEELTYSIKLQGTHWALNSVAALGAAMSIGAESKELLKGLSSLEPIKGRGQVLTTPFNNGYIKVVDDSYNASPASMKAAIICLGEKTQIKEGRRVAILGDMLELGTEASKAHASLASTCSNAGIDFVFTAGSLMANLYAALPPEIRGNHYASTEKLCSCLDQIIKPSDTILVKGSQGAQMGQVVNALTSKCINYNNNQG